MKVYITKRPHYRYNYLANWQNPDNRFMMGCWFTSIKELKEYTDGWNCEYVFVNQIQTINQKGDQEQCYWEIT